MIMLIGGLVAFVFSAILLGIVFDAVDRASLAIPMIALSVLGMLGGLILIGSYFDPHMTQSTTAEITVTVGE